MAVPGQTKKFRGVTTGFANVEAYGICKSCISVMNIWCICHWSFKVIWADINNLLIYLKYSNVFFQFFFWRATHSGNGIQFSSANSSEVNGCLYLEYFLWLVLFSFLSLFKFFSWNLIIFSCDIGVTVNPYNSQSKVHVLCRNPRTVCKICADKYILLLIINEGMYCTADLSTCSIFVRITCVGGPSSLHYVLGLMLLVSRLTTGF